MSFIKQSTYFVVYYFVPRKIPLTSFSGRSYRDGSQGSFRIGTARRTKNGGFSAGWQPWNPPQTTLSTFKLSIKNTFLEKKKTAKTSWGVRCRSSDDMFWFKQNVGIGVVDLDVFPPSRWRINGVLFWKKGAMILFQVEICEARIKKATCINLP